MSNFFRTDLNKFLYKINNYKPYRINNYKPYRRYYSRDKLKPKRTQRILSQRQKPFPSEPRNIKKAPGVN